MSRALPGLICTEGAGHPVARNCATAFIVFAPTTGVAAQPRQPVVLQSATASPIEIAFDLRVRTYLWESRLRPETKRHG